MDRSTPHDDLEWALERTLRMRDFAEKDAQVYGAKLLKGHGYPDEVFSRAQDARALDIVLGELARRMVTP